MQKQLRHYIVAFVGMLIIVSVYLLWPRSSLRDSGVDLISAVIEGDTERALRYLSSFEKSEGQVGYSSINTLLNNSLKTGLLGFVKDGAIFEYPDKNPNHFVLGQMFVHPDGRRVSLGFDMQRTADGPKAKTFVASVIATLIQIQVPISTPPFGTATMKAKCEVFEANLPKFEKLGLDGYVIDIPSGSPLAMYSWNELIEFRRRLVDESLSAERANAENSR